MDTILKFIADNYDRLPLVVVILLVIACIVGAIAYFWMHRPPKPATQTVSVSVTQNLNSPNNNSTESKGDETNAEKPDLKSNIRILFIDDDKKFKIVRILKNAGWSYVELVTDVNNIDSPEIKEANIIFVDIKGVGRKLAFKGEGLGLVKAIKDRFPDKRVVIYSATLDHDPFDEGFRSADDRIRKNAEPYQFESIIRRLFK